MVEEVFGNGLRTVRGYRPETGLFNLQQSGFTAEIDANLSVQHIAVSFDAHGSIIAKSDGASSYTYGHNGACCRRADNLRNRGTPGTPATSMRTFVRANSALIENNPLTILR